MSIWHSPPDIVAINQSSTGTMAGQLGILITDIGEDYLSGTMPVDERTRQPVGYLHGGASVVLAETLGSLASVLCVDKTKKSIFGLEINANHVSAIRSGTLTGTVRPVHLGQTTHVWDIRITSEKNRLICISRFTSIVRDIR